MSYAVDVSQSAVLDILYDFIAGAVPVDPNNIVRGLGNDVPMPEGPFVAMTVTGQKRLSTNIDNYTDPVTSIGARAIQQNSQLTVQIDCYGPKSNDWAVILTTLFRDPYGCDALAPNVSPLYADDPNMIPLTNAEANYEERWFITAVLQYNPVVTVPQQFAAVAHVNLVEVDKP